MERDKKRALGVWKEIYNRCYDEKHKDFKSYGKKGTIICEEWHNFNNFYDWYNENYYSIEGEYMAVDKDILGGGKNIYSPDTCIIVPFKINGLFIHKDNSVMRGLQKRGDFYEVKVRNPFTKKNDYCGRYTTPEIAQTVYQKCKKEILVGMAEEYKNKIPIKLYKALINYKF